MHAKKSFKFPVSGECIAPDVFSGKTIEQIGELKMWEGNAVVDLQDLFWLENDNELDDEFVLEIFGDLSLVNGIGKGMSIGNLIINGTAGDRLGEQMKGGKIAVFGDAGSWVGCSMKKGMVEVSGNIGDYGGSSRRGSNQGMADGSIVVHGNAGNETGAYMSKGNIKVLGDIGQFCGLRMREGTIYVKGRCAARAGACMTGGKIIVGGSLESVLPSFSIDGLGLKAKIDENESIEGPFLIFIGDLVENGNGKLYVLKRANPQLECYERFLQEESR